MPKVLVYDFMYIKLKFYYKKCLEYYPANNYALFGLADCYKALNQYAKAIDIWQQYLVHDDKNITVITRVADAYRKIHEFKKSKELYLKVLEMEKARLDVNVSRVKYESIVDEAESKAAALRIMKKAEADAYGYQASAEAKEMKEKHSELPHGGSVIYSGKTGDKKHVINRIRREVTGIVRKK